jgi:hypothetical protein
MMILRGNLRAAAYSRLVACFQFVNELKLFPEVGNRRRYSINVFKTKSEYNKFILLCNLFNTNTIQASLSHDGSGDVGGYKTQDGHWNVDGHLDRVIQIDTEKLEIFAKFYDKPGTPANKARLPSSLHAGKLLSVIEKMANYPAKLAFSCGKHFSSEMFHETYAKHDGTIIRNEDRTAPFPSKYDSLILSGPHFHIANPFYQTPRSICDTRRAYDLIDLSLLPPDYLPRTNFLPMANHDEYLNRIQQVGWIDNNVNQSKRFTEYYRLAFRNMMVSSNERTMLSAIIPKGVAHPHSVISTAFDNQNNLIKAAAVCASVIGDYFIKSSGRGGLYDGWMHLPAIKINNDLALRVLSLNSLTMAYAELWENLYNEDFTNIKWSNNSNKRLSHNFFAKLNHKWSKESALRDYYSRYMALVEIDVLVAIEIGLKLDELILIYRIQFPVMQQYERETWYDINGHIVFTVSKGLVGVGLPRRRKRTDEVITVTFTNGSSREVEGWDEIRKLQDEGKLLDGSVVSTTVMDDTQPGGPVRRERKYVAPFALANREEDYRIAWEFFERKMLNLKLNDYVALTPST